MKFHSRSLFLLALAGVACAQQPPQPQTPKLGPLGELRATRGVFRDYAEWLEPQITERALGRADVKGVAKTRLELELDLRLLATWAATAQGDDEVLAGGYLRLRQILEAMYLLDEYLTDQRVAGLTPGESAALARLHALTYKLPEPNSIADLDMTSRTIGVCILQVVSAKPFNENVLPAMRPQTVPAAPNFAPTDEAKTPPPPSQVDPERTLPTLNVSPALRQQMLQTQQALRDAEASRSAPAEAQALRRMLHDAIDLASGFSANAATSGEQRMELEQQLTEALALYVDPRTRSIARSRIDGLSQYRHLVRLLGELKLSPQNYQLLAPAFNYAQKNPDKAAPVLTSVRAFVDMAGRYETMPRDIIATAQLTRLPAMYQEARKTFEQHRNLYLGAVAGLDGTSLMDSTPDTLNTSLDDMRLSFDVVSMMGKLIGAVDTLNSYKPRPAGGLEKFIAKESGVAASPTQGPLRAQAIHSLQDLIALAESAKELSHLDFASLPADSLTEMGIARVGDLDAKWKLNVTQIASEAAAGTPLDRQAVQRNQALPRLVASLKTAVDTQATMKNAPMLARWTDWDGDRASLDLVLTPYLLSLNAAVTSFLNDSTAAIQELPKVEYASYPLRTLLVRDLQAGPQLASLPGGLPGVCGKLATPFNQFPAERYTTLGIVVWARARAGGDVPAAEIALKLVSRRIAAELHLKFDESRASFATADLRTPTTTPTTTTPTRNKRDIVRPR